MNIDASKRSPIVLLGAALLLCVPLTATAHPSQPEVDEERDRQEQIEAEEVRRYRVRQPRTRVYVKREPHYHEAPRRGWTTQVGAGGGWFAPWQGDHGSQEQAEILWTSPSGHFRFGAEFVHRQFETRVFDVDDVNVHSYQGNMVFHGVLNPGHLTPYLGAGIGLHANDFSRNDITRGNPGLVVPDDVGLGYGVFGILGVEMPVGEQLSFFAEGRVNLALQVTGTDRFLNAAYADFYHQGVDDAQTEDMGGGSAVFGARLRF